MRARGMSLSVQLGALATLVVCGGLLQTGSASALTYEEKGTFCEASGPPCPEFTKPAALTVDPASGDLLVVDVEAKTIRRFKPDGTPDNFSLLGTNTIDGKRSGAVNECPTVPADCDETPENGLDFGFNNPREVQIAVAPPGSAGGTAGDIYITQPDHSHNFIDIFSSAGGYLGQLSEFKEGPTASGAFKRFALTGFTGGVAVDPSGAVYVSDFSNKEIHRYVPTANPVTRADSSANFQRISGEPPGPTGPATLAAGMGPTSGFIFADKFGSEPLKIHSEGAEAGTAQYAVTSEESLALAVNPANGRLLSASESKVKEWDASGASEAILESEFTPGGALRGVAVDGTRGLVYVAKEGLHTIEVWESVGAPEAKTLPATPVGHESATLRGEVNPKGEALTKCVFEWGKTESYGNEAPCEEPNAAEVGSGSSFVAVHAKVEGLEPGLKYHYRLVIANSNTPAGIKGEDKSFTATGPALFGEGAAEVGATSASATATIDPNGEATEVRVQFLSDAAFQANPEGERFLGALQSEERELAATTAGTGNLTAGSPIVTEASATEGAFGPGETITGPGIPAGTKIESLPSPSELKLSKGATETAKGAALSASGPQPVRQLLAGLVPNTTYHFRFLAESAGGTTTGTGAQLTTGPLPEEAQLQEAGCPNTGLRGGPAAALPDCRAYELVSPSQKAGEVIPPEPLGGTCNPTIGCLPGPFERTRPMQSASGGGSVLYSGQPFTAGLPGGQNAYLSVRGTSAWGLQALNPLATTGTWEAFSADLSRGILAQGEPALAPTAPTRGGKAFANLYLSAAGTLTPLITEEPPNRSPGPVADRLRAHFVAANAGTAATEAFTHIAFEANDSLTGPTAEAPEAPQVPAAAECASPSSPCDLYEWSGGQLSLINVKPGSSTEALGQAAIGGGRLLERSAGHEAPAVDGAISADGRRIFWTSEETGHVYARVEGTETLEVPGPGTCKRSEPLSSRACFLTASADGTQILLSDGELFALNGAGSAYELEEDLTEGQGGFEGYLAAGEEGGRITRIYFADPKVLPGAAPNAEGEEAEELAGHVNLYYWHEGASRFIASLVAGDDAGEFFGTWRAPRADRTAQATADGRYLAFTSRAPLTGFLTTCTTTNGSTPCSEVFEYAADTGKLTCPSCNPSGQPPLGPSNLTRLSVLSGAPDFRQPGNLPPQGNGRLFFESQDALLPQDTNGHIQDVYEWEPGGVGTCTKAAGCLRLISSGASASDSMFLDASETGDDAFLITRQQLVGADEDAQLDLYDARVGGGFTPQGEPAPCAGEGCREALAEPPPSPSAASQSFVGPGNPKQPKQSKAHHKKKKSKKHKRHQRAAKHNRGGRR